MSTRFGWNSWDTGTTRGELFAAQQAEIKARAHEAPKLPPVMIVPMSSTSLVGTVEKTGRPTYTPIGADVCVKNLIAAALVDDIESASTIEGNHIRKCPQDTRRVDGIAARCKIRYD